MEEVFQLKILSWNVNGLRSALKKHKDTQIPIRDGPDYICLQETRLPRKDDASYFFHASGYHTYENRGNDPGHSGVMTLSRETAREVETDVGDGRLNQEGRLLVVQYSRYCFINVYLPVMANGSRSKGREKRHLWNEKLIRLLIRKQRQSPVVLCGDFNGISGWQDTHEQHRRRKAVNQVFRSEDDDLLLQLEELKFIDSFRYLHPEESGYTWWSRRNERRTKEIGSRLDYIFVSADLAPGLKEASVHSEVSGSDHCPVSVTLT